MGMLDQLFAPQDPAAFQMGALGNEDDPRYNVPAYDDYSGGVPVKKKPEKVFGDDLKKFQETHPLTPQTAAEAAPPMAAAGPLPGMLGSEMGGPYGAVPGATGAGPPAAQAQAAPPTPLPRPRPAGASGPVAVAPPPEAAIPPNAAPISGQRVGSPAEGAIDMTDASPSMLSKAWKGIQDNSNLLMGMGAGMMGAPSWATGFGRGFAGAQAGAAQDQKLNLQTGAAQQLAVALVQAGVPRQQAIAATTNPELAKALIASHITDRGKDIQMIKSKDAFGNETETPYVKNKYPAEGEPILTPAFKDQQGNATAAPGIANSSGATYAPGVTATTFDHSKIGDDYLQQFSPEMQAGVKNYLAGNSLPTGRGQLAQAIKLAAQKYGNDIGMPADEAAIGQRKIWSNSLGNTQSGVGLQSKGFQQGLEHFSKLSDNLVKMHLSNGFGLEPVAGAINSAKNLTANQQLLVHKSDVEGQALAREMGNLFSKNGGGVHEAAETKKNVSNSTMSSKSAAGSLEAIDELMHGGLSTLEQRRDELFPTGNAPKGSQFLGPKQEAALAHIRNNIAILKGETSESAQGGQPQAQTATGPNGHQIVVRGGRWVDATTGAPVQ